MSLNKKYVAKLSDVELDALILKSEDQCKKYADDEVIVAEYKSDLKQLKQEQQDRLGIPEFTVSQEDFDALVTKVTALEAICKTLDGKVTKLQATAL